MSKISIIIPVLNEANTISQLLQYVIDHSSPQNIADIIVVDGGSNDNSKEIIATFHQVILINSEKGRAKQMNTGTKNATGTILYFLHADSFPPKHFDELIISEVMKGNEAGCFRMQFDSNHWWLKLAGWLTTFNWRICRGGDQSQFITKMLFETIGGFDESYVVYEDNILINELYKRKLFVVIQQPITTSSRLYEKHGIWKVQFHFWMIYVKKFFGASAEDLHHYYLKHFR